MKKLQAGHVLAFIAMGLVVVAVIVSAIAYVLSQRETGLTRSCKKSSDLEVCLLIQNTEKQEYDNLDATVEISNLSSMDFTTTFNSGCTGPVMVVEERDVLELSVCTLALKDVVIGSGKTKSYEVSVSAREFTVGENTIKARWAGLESGEVKLNYYQTDEASIDYSTCADEGAQDYAYCATLHVEIDVNRQDSCRQVLATAEDQKLGIILDSCEIGFLALTVPETTVDELKSQLLAVPGVTAASIPGDR